MTTYTNATAKATRRKLNLLELANELENVSKACKIMGYSPQRKPDPATRKIRS
ncbi:hypothetical protein [Leptospira fluminis]|uniref:hypothetical protein n=1 Tax=Leptospira fluminis TaxID=2484979 RepID=UPI003CCC7F81